MSNGIYRKLFNARILIKYRSQIRKNFDHLDDTTTDRMMTLYCRIQPSSARSSLSSTIVEWDTFAHFGEGKESSFARVIRLWFSPEG